MADNRAYLGEAASEGPFDDISLSNLAARSQDGKGADCEAPDEYDRRSNPASPIGNVSRRALIPGFLVAVLVTIVAGGMAVWYIPRIRGRCESYNSLTEVYAKFKFLGSLAMVFGIAPQLH